jgi:hypothetical protein
MDEVVDVEGEQLVDASPDEPPPPAQRSPARRTWSLLRRRWVIVSYAVLVLAIGWEYGLLSRRRSFPFATVWSVQGWSRCFADGLVPCTYVGHPLGLRLSLGTTYNLAVYGFSLLGIGPVVAFNLAALGAIALGAAAIGWTVHCLGARPMAGLLAAGLYFVSPVVITNRLLPSLYFSFALMAVPIACVADVVVSISGGRLRRAIGGLVAAMLGGFVVVFSDPYGWFIGGVLAGALAIVALVGALRDRDRVGVGLSLGAFLALAIPGVAFAAVAGSESATTMPRAFYRAMGADVGLMLAPSQRSWLSTVAKMPGVAVDRTDYYGDGSNLGVFIGLFSVAAALLGGWWFLRSRAGRDRGPIVGFAAGGLICLLLGLGPSFKIFDTADHPVAPDGAYVVGDYLMPASRATMGFPWSPLYGMQPISSLRTAYRWHAGLRLVLAVFGGVALVELYQRRRRVVAVAFGAVLVLEAGTIDLTIARDRAATDYRQFRAFEYDMNAAYGNGGLRPSERVLFLPAANDFLLMGTAPHYRVRTWNVLFDKELARITPQQPKEINAARKAYSKGSFDADQMCSLFTHDLVDAVVLSEYSQRWDSYRWPPDPAARKELRAQMKSTGVLADPRFQVDDRDLSAIVRAEPSGPCRVSAGKSP